MHWQSWVASPPFSQDEKTLHLRALEARPHFEAIEQALRAPISTERLLELAALITVGRPALTVEALGDPPKFFAWLWPLMENSDTTSLAELLGPAPPRSFHALVTEGRETLPPLEGESVEQWVLVQHAGDGHQFLFWDPTRAGVRLLWVDNSERDVVMHDWPSAEDFLRRRFFPQQLHHREDLAKHWKTPLRRSLELWLALAGLFVLFAATIGLIGLLVFR